LWRSYDLLPPASRSRSISPLGALNGNKLFVEPFAGFGTVDGHDMVLAWDMTMVVIVIMIIKNLPFMKAGI
jgi:hypothetical protein